VSADLAEAFGLERPSGVVVSRVYPGGPADQAGLRKGDIIVAVDDRPVDDIESLRFRVATGELGGHAEVSLWRDRAPLALDLPLTAAPETPPRNATLLRDRHPLQGATVANLSPALAEELDLLGAWEGIIVTKVAGGSPARQIGFRPGDVVLAVNGVEVSRVAEAVAELGRPAERWSITFGRNGRVRTVEFGG
jgi:serine protease Do